MAFQNRWGPYAPKVVILGAVFCALGAGGVSVEAEPSTKAPGSAYEEPLKGSASQAHRAAGLVDAISCDACHTEVEAARNDPAGDSSYGSYGSPTMDALVGAPDGISRWCLGCHDGAIASGGGSVRSGISADGMENDHPVSFVYDGALARKDGELHDPSAPSSLGGSIASDLLDGGKMQCTSCHNFHSENRSLLKTKRSSSLCLACHDK